MAPNADVEKNEMKNIYYFYLAEAAQKRHYWVG